ncbi:hypothetical protein K502DRAFT_342045 [Neoconidiobolus thromboides FSU 785]|nr:hypothetical protein K502DRAFT_342045 [Neoconidiobolus thromboides FSU 785]
MNSSPKEYKSYYCPCLNIRLNLKTELKKEEADDGVHDEIFQGFRWSLLQRNGAAVEYINLTKREIKDHFSFTKCINCNYEVYAYDVTDSTAFQADTRPILFNIHLLNEEKAEIVRKREDYSKCFRMVVTQDEVDKRIEKKNDELLLAKLKDFEKKELLKMELKIEEFIEKQKKAYSKKINKSKKEKQMIENKLIINQRQDNKDPFALNSINVTIGDIHSPPIKPKACNLEMSDFSSDEDHYAINEDEGDENLFDLDEDINDNNNSIKIDSSNNLEVNETDDSLVENAVIPGSFVAQGKWNASRFKKYSTFDDDDDIKLDLEQENVDNTSNSLYSSSVPIPIHMNKMKPVGIPSTIQEDQVIEEFLPPHLLNHSDAFDQVPKSLSYSLNWKE